MEKIPTEKELTLQKLNMMTKLVELANRGVKLSQNYDINSSYTDMKMEYDLHRIILENKLNMMAKLIEQTNKGVKLSQIYEMSSSYTDMKMEYDLYQIILENKLKEEQKNASKKVNIMVKLMKLVKNGTVLTQTYSLGSSYADMKMEYDLQMALAKN